MKYPWVIPYLNGNEAALVVDAIKSSWISGGPFVNELESQLSTLLGTHTLCVSNGTTALECALRSLNIGPEDEVIVPDFAFIAPAAMVKRLGARLVLADIDSQTWCLDYRDVERKISKKTKAVITVHTYGSCGDLSSLRDLCLGRGIFLVEDAAEAFLSIYKGKYLGTIGDVGTYSFHATKTLTTGEGGAVSMRETSSFELAKKTRDHGMEPSRRYWHPIVGNNFRMTNTQAAIGCAQLQTIEKVCAERKELYRNYLTALSFEPRLVLQKLPEGLSPVMWAFGVFIKNCSESDRDRLILQLKENGVETRPGFYPASKMPPYQNDLGAKTCPNSKTISEGLIALPFYIGLKNEDIQWITKLFLQKIREL